jgi:enoyl-CoA hydratase/carnithine racemase
VGGGLELALAFTLRVAADDVRCVLSEIELGIFPGLGGTQRLARIVGEARALDLILTARPIDAAMALEIGLVTRVVPARDLRNEALRLAQQLAHGPPVAIRMAIDAARRASDLARSDGLAFERRMFGVVCGSQDKDEGVAAFLERRLARFMGR